jgi:hypothetical protein
MMAKEQEKTVLTQEQVDLMTVFARTLMQGDPEEHAEKEALKERRKAMKASMVEAVEKARLTKIAAQQACLHQKENGRPSTGGQMLSNGNVAIICMHCRRIWSVPATVDQRRMIESGDVSLSEVKPPEDRYIVN